MANFETTVRTSILTFPGLHKNRSDVIQHLFFVVGNGYEWRNGELVSKSSVVEPFWTRENAENSFAALINDANMPAADVAYLRGIVLNGAQDVLDEEERVVSEIDVRVNTLGPITPPYVTPNDLMENPPADITPEWQAALAEARTLLASL